MLADCKSARTASARATLFALFGRISLFGMFGRICNPTALYIRICNPH